MKQLRVDCHHNVEDFRPYTIPFKDRGSLEENQKHALRLAVKRESEWNGWFDPFGPLEGKKKEVQAAITELFEGESEVIIFGSDRSEDEQELVDISSVHVGLVIWREDDEGEWNIGFGIAANDDAPINMNDTDKYDNKWVVITK